MLSRLSIFISSRYSHALMFALLVATSGFFWLFNFSSLPFAISNPQLVKISGGAGLLDLKFFYTAQDAYAFLTQYGEEGRELYKHFLSADFVFAFCYGLGFSMLFTRLLRALHGSESGWMKFNLLPLGVALADYSENIFILLMLNQYPENLQIIGMLAGISTLIKQLLTYCSLIFLLIGTARLLARQFKL